MLRRALAGTGLVGVGIVALLLLTAADAHGAGWLVALFAIQGLLAGVLLSSGWAIVVSPCTALAWTPIAGALSTAPSGIPLAVALLVYLACSLTGAAVALIWTLGVGKRPPTQLGPPLTALLTIALGLSAIGCGGGQLGSSASTTGSGRTGSPAAPTTRDALSGATAKATTRARRTPSEAAAAAPATTEGSVAPPATSPPASLGGRRGTVTFPGGPRPPARTLPNGTVIVPPAAPTSVQEPASDACDSAEVTRGGRRIRVEVPPAPGLRASRDGQVVHVTVDTGRPPQRCAPRSISVALVDAGTMRAAHSRDLLLRRLGTRTIDLTIGDAFDPDVARATAVTADGRVSASTRIRLTG